MTRIIGGRFGGRTISAPKGSSTRPTSDRVREALFSRLDAWEAVAGERVLDLYAGSGALGLEAASRGAIRVDFVEADQGAARVIRANLAALREVSGSVQVASVRTFAGRAGAEPAGLIFADPPYPLRDADLGADLAALALGGHLAPEALLVIERSTRSPEPTWPAGVELVDQRRYGETSLWFARRAPAEPLVGSPL